MNKSTRLMITAAAMAGLYAGALTTKAHAFGGASTSTEEKAKDSCKGKDGCKAADGSKAHDCAGKNDCKGHGGCKSGDNGCKGKNSCKGKGGCKTEVAEPKK